MHGKTHQELTEENASLRRAVDGDKIGRRALLDKVKLLEEDNALLREALVNHAREATKVSPHC